MTDDPDAFTSVATATTDDKHKQLAAIIRNGLSNGPIAQSQAAWRHLQTRLDEIVDALLKEI